MTVLDQEWADRITAASADRSGSYSGTVAIELGKKDKAVLAIVDGQVVSTAVGEDALAAADSAEPGAPVPDDGTPAPVGVTIPMTDEQLGSFLDGTASLARAYMVGDVKPVGATGPLLALVELFESEEFRSRL